MTLSQLLPQLLALKKVTVIPPRPMSNPLPRWYNPNARCEFHSGGAGHETDNCYNLKHRVQDLIDQKLLIFKQEDKPNVMLNALFPLMRSEVAAQLLLQI